jgi:uncharacterized protein YecE (DUF72 family)
LSAPPRGPIDPDRFRPIFDYTAEELVDVAESTRDLSRRAEITEVIFNNNYGDQGPRNGREMIKLLAASSW